MYFWLHQCFILLTLIHFCSLAEYAAAPVLLSGQM